MLLEVRCDQFMVDDKPREPIRFKAGLSAVLGSEEADNSIGKSTFLMILDFVFGGDDYLKKSTDVQDQIGPHTIKFTFLFDDIEHHFSRGTTTANEVNVCDEDYNIQATKPLDEYTSFLFEKYRIGLPYISFRDVVSRYIRVYGRDNLDEHHPLQVAKREQESKAIDSLVKLFDKYADIADLKQQEKDASERLSALRKAHKHDFVTGATTKKQIKENETQIRAYEEELQTFLEGNNDAKQLLGLDAVIAGLIADMKQRASMLRREKNKLLLQLSRIEENTAEAFPLTEDDLGELLRFFPNADIKSINEVERFHHELLGILDAEYSEARGSTLLLIEQADREIAALDAEIAKTGISSALSKSSFDTYAEISRKIEALKDENSYKGFVNSLAEEKKAISEQLAAASEDNLHTLENTVNETMDAINDYITDSRRNSPELEISETGKTYKFATPLDTGTGTSFKGMVVFDLAVASRTSLPIIVHDSYVLKHIGDWPLVKILELYQQLGKQVFIASDKKSSFPVSAQVILGDATVLNLADGSGALFGRSWNIKSSTISATEGEQDA
jgi:hypothetical protein